MERGPLVDCLEQADQSAEVLIDDVWLVPGEGAAAWSPDLLGGVTAIQMTGWAMEDRMPLYERAASHAGDPGRLVQLTGTPYFAWAQSGAGPMRVWIPLARSG